MSGLSVCADWWWRLRHRRTMRRRLGLDDCGGVVANTLKARVNLLARLPLVEQPKGARKCTQQEAGSNPARSLPKAFLAHGPAQRAPLSGLEGVTPDASSSQPYEREEVPYPKTSRARMRKAPTRIEAQPNRNEMDTSMVTETNTPRQAPTGECDGPDVTKAARCLQEFVELYTMFLAAEDRVIATGEGRTYAKSLARRIDDVYYTWRRQFADVPGNLAYELKGAALNAVREARAVKAP